jgi:hypothetical protein
VTLVTVGASGRIATSTDGKSWTAQTSPAAQELFGVAHGNGTFVAVGAGGAAANSIVWASDSDVTIWTPAATNPAPGPIYAVAFGNGVFIAVGQGVSTNASILRSADNGVTWTVESIGATYLKSITYANGQFVAVGPFAPESLIYTSPTGNTGSWTLRDSNATELLSSIGYGNGLYVVTSSGSNGTVLTSPDAITWTMRSAPASSHYGITFGNGFFVIVGSRGLVLVGTDGSDWTGGTFYMVDHFSSVLWSTIGGGAYYITQDLTP